MPTVTWCGGAGPWLSFYAALLFAAVCLEILPLHRGRAWSQVSCACALLVLLSHPALHFVHSAEVGVAL